MKKRELVEIEFKHNNVPYTARVQKYAPTAIILPDRTVLKTNCIVLHSSGHRRNIDQPKHTRQIFNGTGELVPLDLLRHPKDWDKPLDTRFPVIFAKEA